MADYYPAEIVDALSQSHDLGIFLRIESDPPLHIWFGDEDKPAGFDSIDADGTIYMGGGFLIGVPTLEVLINGTSDSVDFTLTGVDPRTSARFLDSIPSVRGVPVNLGITTLDEYFQPMSKIISIWEGIASHVSEASSSVGYDDSPSISLSLSVVSGEATRSQSTRSLWTSPHQQAISSTDQFCGNVYRYVTTYQLIWPNF